MATLWLLLALGILLAVYATLPYIVDATLKSANAHENASSEIARSNVETSKAPADSKAPSNQIILIVSLTFGFCAVAYAAFLISKSAQVEFEAASHFGGLADAVCVAGENFEQFEKAAALLVPKFSALSNASRFSAKDLQSIAEMLKQLR